jgi:cytochrome P450 family 4
MTLSTFHPLSRSGFPELTTLYHEETKNLKILHDFTRKIISARKEELENGIRKKDDDWLILNNYLDAKIDGKPFTDDEIRTELNTIIFGSHDTIKSGMAFVLYCLAKYPEEQKKVFDEAMELIGKDIRRDVHEEELELLPCTDAFIRETLRLFPPVAYFGRKIGSEVTTGGYTFPKDAEIIFSPYLMGRNPKYFKDPLKFDPSRFYGKDPHPEGYIPFSMVPRKCPGSKIAYLAIKMLVLKLVPIFKFSLPKECKELEVFIEITLKNKYGIFLDFEQRKN